MRAILYIQSAAERGGVETILLNYLRGIDRSRFLPHVIFTSDGPFYQEVAATGGPVSFIDAGQVRDIPRTLQTIRQIAGYLRREKITLVHGHGDKAHFYGGWAARLAGVPAVHHLHAVPGFGLRRDDLIGVLGLTTPRTHTLAVSEVVAEATRTRPFSPRGIRVLHNGIDLPAIPASARGIWRRRYGIEDSQPLVALFARLQRWKGVHLFVEAAARVSALHPEVRFWVVGGSLLGLEPEYADECRALASRLGLEGKLQFLGFCDRVYEAMSAADILTNTSISLDPFPTVVLEAMALGKPVIATNLGGAVEAIEHGRTGFLIPPEPDKLAECIGQLVSDPVRAARLGAAARRHYEESFTLKAMMTSVQNLYGEARTE